MDDSGVAPDLLRRSVSVESDFAERGVITIAEFLTPEEFDQLRRHVDSKVRGGLFRSMEGDGQVDGAPCEYADPAAEQLLSAKASFLGELLHLDLVPSYSYMRLYRPGDRLPPHRDRPACEITVSASLAADAVWPLQILLESHIVEYCPPPRGAVVFRGHDLLHWRDALSGDGPVAHVFFHYVQRHGFSRSWAYDRRPHATQAPQERAPCS